MIELTEQQRQVLEQPENQPAVVETNTSYLLVRREVYERVKDLLYDDGDWTPDEQLQLLADSGRRAGWNDPAMDVYDDYEANRKKLCP